MDDKAFVEIYQATRATMDILRKEAYDLTEERGTSSIKGETHKIVVHRGDAEAGTTNYISVEKN